VTINEDRNIGAIPTSTCNADEMLNSITEQQVRALIDPDTIINPLFIKDSSIELNKISTPIKFAKKTPQNDESIMSSSENSLILSTSPFNEFVPKLYSSSTAISADQKETYKLLELDKNLVVSSEDQTAVNKPLFTSEMTNSQISTELSNEIGYEWE